MGDARFTHAWGGVWGAARDWAPAVGYEPGSRLAWAGGYGDGVCASNFAPRTIADLVLRRDSELTRYPWVNHRSPAWPPDPLPRMAARLVCGAYGLADVVTERTGRGPRLGHAHRSRLANGRQVSGAQPMWRVRD